MEDLTTPGVGESAADTSDTTQMPLETADDATFESQDGGDAAAAAPASTAKADTTTWSDEELSRIVFNLGDAPKASESTRAGVERAIATKAESPAIRKALDHLKDLDDTDPTKLALTELVNEANAEMSETRRFMAELRREREQTAAAAKRAEQEREVQSLQTAATWLNSNGYKAVTQAQSAQWLQVAKQLIAMRPGALPESAAKTAATFLFGGVNKPAPRVNREGTASSTPNRKSVEEMSDGERLAAFKRQVSGAVA